MDLDKGMGVAGPGGSSAGCERSDTPCSKDRTFYSAIAMLTLIAGAIRRPGSAPAE